MSYTDKLSDILRTLAAFVAAQIVGFLLIRLLGGLFAGYRYNILLNVICTLGVNSAAYLLICGKIKLPEKCADYSHIELPSYLFGSIFLSCLAAIIGKLLPVSSSASAAPQGTDLVLYAVYTIILAPIAEEIAFRGAALSRLRNSLGGYSAAFISAALFSGYHMSLVQAPFTFVLGFCLAMLAQRSGSIVPCIIIHAINNFLTLASSMWEVAAVVTDFAVPILGAAGIMFIAITRRYKLQKND